MTIFLEETKYDKHLLFISHFVQQNVLMDFIFAETSSINPYASYLFMVFPSSIMPNMACLESESSQCHVF